MGNRYCKDKQTGKRIDRHQLFVEADRELADPQEKQRELELRERIDRHKHTNGRQPPSLT